MELLILIGVPAISGLDWKGRKPPETEALTGYEMTWHPDENKEQEMEFIIFIITILIILIILSCAADNAGNRKRKMKILLSDAGGRLQ
jgi:hypothetical protein